MMNRVHSPGWLSARDAAPVVLHDAVTDRQPQARALTGFLGAEKGVEYLGR